MVKNLLSILFLLLSFTARAQWTRTDGLPGGPVTGFSAMGDTVVANFGGDMYFTADEGQHWSLMPLPPNFLTYDFTTSAQHIFLLAYSPYRLIAHSTDFGQSWTNFYCPDSIFSNNLIAIDDYIYGSNFNGLFRTNNNGVSWETVIAEPIFISSVSDDGTLVGGFQNYLMQSVDQGFTWDTLCQYPGNAVGSLVHENWIFAFGEFSDQGCWVSADYGQTWNQYPGTAFGQSSAFLWHNGTVLVLRGDKILRSSDKGQSWTSYLLDYLPGVPAYAGISVGNTVLIGGDNSGVNRSVDGVLWTPSNNGLKSNGSNKLHRSDGKLFAAAHGGVYELDADLNHWSLLDNVPLPWGMTWYGIRDFYKSGNHLVVSDGLFPWFSSDNGANWQQSDVSSNESTGSFPSFFEAGNRLFMDYVIDENVWPFFVSDDQGEHFEPFLSLYNQLNLYSLAKASDGGNIYMLGVDKKIYRSSDAGAHWNILSAYVPLELISPDGLTQDINMLIAAHSVIISQDVASKKMLVSNNLGGTWTLVDYSATGYPWGYFGLMDMKPVGNHLVAATQNAILLSTDGGLNWTNWGDGLPGFWLAALEIHNGFLWAGLKGGGIWKRPIGDPGAMQAASGIVFNDLNLNGLRDAGEPGLPNVIVQSGVGNAFTTTNTDGSYTLLSGNVDESIEVVPPALYWNTNPTAHTVTLPAGDLNFALSIDSTARDLYVSLVNVALFQPGFNNKLILNWRNNVPLPAPNVTLSLDLPPGLLDYLSANPLPASQNAGVLTWQLGNLAAGANGTITVNVRVPDSVSVDTIICTEAAIWPQAGDLIPADNHRQLCGHVVASFDPNDKQSDPPSHITPEEIANGKPVVYTIRFQNLGTAPATFIRIADTLDAAFQPGSFQFLGSSHPCSWTLQNEGKLEFYFHNIQLPPASQDEPGSHGYVQYAVRARPDQSLGTLLRNTAHIYFDYNAPVTTNTTQLEVSTTSAVHQTPLPAEMRVFPNPASGAVQLDLPASGVLTARSSDGRLVLKRTAREGLLRLDLAGWPAGKYVLILESGEKRYEAALIIP